MVQTYNRRLTKGAMDHIHPDLFIMDEVHRGEFYKVIQEITAPIIGFTATPKTASKDYELKDIFDDIVIGLKTSELIRLGRIAPGVTFSLKPDLSKVKKKGKEYDDKSLLEAFKKAELYDGAIDRYYELCPERKAMHYCVNVDHALEKLLQHKERGCKNLYHADGKHCFKLIDGELKLIPRSDAFEMFSSDKHAVMTNIGTATTGFDCADLTCIIQDFATMSITKHWQTIGRGGRVCDDKNNFYVIDAGRNWVRHKYYGEDVDWEDIFHNPKRAEAADGLRKDKRECEECNMLISMHTKICPYCNEIYSKEEIEKFILEGASAEVIKEYKFQQLPVQLRIPVQNMDLTQLREYGRLMGYKLSWANIVWAKRNQRQLNFKHGHGKRG
jgi:superfamily II DNA or RNA helicase